MEGLKHLALVLGCFLIRAPVGANGWMTLKTPLPAPRSDLAIVPLEPAPLEFPTTPLIHENAMPFWSYPTEIEFVEYRDPPRRRLWVAQALERYRIRLLSPIEMPYTLARAPVLPTTIKP
jgi:hypothetical protein